MADATEATELGSIQLTLVFYGLATVVKLVGFFFTGVMVVLADALHSLRDILVFSILLVGSS